MGLAHALGGQYDVLIVDRRLPKIDDLEVIAALRGKGINTPALILSALGQIDDRVKGLWAGGDDYLAKPYSFSDCWRDRKCWHVRARVLRKRFIASPTSNSIGLHDV
jgi:FixJ family two-component response regulator